MILLRCPRVTLDYQYMGSESERSECPNEAIACGPLISGLLRENAMTFVHILCAYNVRDDRIRLYKF
jgi:hypothetical protein